MNPDVEWSIREKLSLSSYVLQSGNQHWSGSVTRMLRSLGEPNRPSDWFSAKNCAQQYSALIEAAETPRRKRGERSESNDSTSGVSSPATLSIGDVIVRKLTQERIEELRKQIRSERAKYKKLKNTLAQVEAGELDDKLDDMVAEIQRKRAEAEKHDEIETKVNTTTEPKETKGIEMETEGVQQEDQHDKEVVPVQSTDPTIIDNIAPNQISASVEESNEVEMLVDVDTNDETIMEAEQTPADDVDNKATADQGTVTAVPVLDQNQSIDTVNDTMYPDEQTDINIDKQAEIINFEKTSEAEEETCQPNENMEENEVSLPGATKLPNSTHLDSNTEDIEPVTSMETHAPEVKDDLEIPADETKDLEEAVEKSNDIEAQSEDTHNQTQDKEETTPSTVTEPSAYDKEESVNVDTLELAETGDTENLEDDAAVDEAKEDISAKDVVPVPQEKEEESIVEEDNMSHASTSVAEDGNGSEQNEGYSASMPSTPAYIDSFPSSPALSTTSDADPEATANFRAWKKSIMILWKQVASHRYASLFLQPVTDDIAPNYSNVVYRAMDLSTLKKNLETGVVRTTSEFQRDLMLMFQNALMYNNREHDVYKMALDMQKDVMDQVAQFLATQLMMETAQQSTPKGLRRSTLRKSAMSEKVSEARSKRTAAIEGELKFMKKKPPHE